MNRCRNRRSSEDGFESHPCITGIGFSCSKRSLGDYEAASLGAAESKMEHQHQENLVSASAYEAAITWRPVLFSKTKAALT